MIVFRLMASREGADRVGGGSAASQSALVRLVAFTDDPPQQSSNHSGSASYRPPLSRQTAFLVLQSTAARARLVAPDFF